MQKLEFRATWKNFNMKIFIIILFIYLLKIFI